MNYGYIDTPLFSTVNGMMALPLGFNNHGSVSYLVNGEANGSMMITGASGSGKTHLLTRLILGLRQVHPVIAICFHDDLSASLGGGCSVTSEGAGGEGINPLDISSSAIEKYGSEWCVSRCCAVIEKAVGKMGCRQYDVLFSALSVMVGQNASEREGGGDRRITLASFVESIMDLHDKTESAKERELLSSVISRLNKFAFIKIFNRDKNLDVARLLQHGGVINLASMRGESRTLIFETIMNMIIDQTFISGSVRSGFHNKNTYIVVDEAKIAFGDSRSKNCSDHPLNVIVTEGRKYGLSLLLASQRADHFSEDVSANVAVRMLQGPISNPREQKKIASSFGLTKEAMRFLSLKGFSYIASGTIPAGIYKTVWS